MTSTALRTEESDTSAGNHVRRAASPGIPFVLNSIFLLVSTALIAFEPPIRSVLY